MYLLGKEGVELGTRVFNDITGLRRQDNMNGQRLLQGLGDLRNNDVGFSAFSNKTAINIGQLSIFSSTARDLSEITRIIDF